MNKNSLVGHRYLIPFLRFERAHAFHLLIAESVNFEPAPYSNPLERPVKRIRIVNILVIALYERTVHGPIQLFSILFIRFSAVVCFILYLFILLSDPLLFL